MNDVSLLPQAGWQRDAAERTGPVFLTRYIGGGKLTMGGPYASAQAAMLASDIPIWLANGDGSYRSQEGRDLIELAKE